MWRKTLNALRLWYLHPLEQGCLHTLKPSRMILRGDKEVEIGRGRGKKEQKAVRRRNPAFLSETSCQTMSTFPAVTLLFLHFKNWVPTITVWLKHLRSDPDGEREVFRNDWSQSFLSQGPFRNTQRHIKSTNTSTYTVFVHKSPDGDEWLEGTERKQRISTQTVSKLSPVDASHLSRLIGCIRRELKIKVRLISKLKYWHSNNGCKLKN